MSCCIGLPRNVPTEKTQKLEFFVIPEGDELLVWLSKRSGCPKCPENIDSTSLWKQGYHPKVVELAPGTLFLVEVQGVNVKNHVTVQVFDGEFWFHRYSLTDPLVSAEVVLSEVSDISQSDPVVVASTPVTIAEPRFNGKKAHLCSITFDWFDEQKGINHCCGHFVSGGALNQHVRFECGKTFEEILSRWGRVYCPLRGHGCNSSVPYALHDMVSFLSKDTLELYLKAQQRVSYHQGLHSNEILEARQLLETQLRSLFERPDGTFSAYQCPECGFGPIEHAHCDDLAAHQQEVMDGATKPVDNRCPECGYFAHQISDWVAWDGNVHANLLPSLKTPPDVESQPCRPCIIS